MQRRPESIFLPGRNNIYNNNRYNQGLLSDRQYFNVPSIPIALNKSSPIFNITKKL